MGEHPRVMHAPWRERYLKSLAGAERACADANDPSPGADSAGCFLRDYWLTPAQDEANLVVLRRPDAPGEKAGEGTGGLVLLNLYPYANGHLLVALGEGRPRLLDYSPAQRAALWSLVEDAARILERALRPQGVNIGINEGRAAGAGVPQHVHVHLVPRWHGDVNFMTVVGGVRVNPSAPENVARLCREAWGEIGRARSG